MEEIEKELLTTLGRILVYLARSGKKKVRISDLRKYTSSQAYASAFVGDKLGLLIYDYKDKTAELTEKGRRLAECLVECLENI